MSNLAELKKRIEEDKNCDCSICEGFKDGVKQTLECVIGTIDEKMIDIEDVYENIDDDWFVKDEIKYETYEKLKQEIQELLDDIKIGESK